MERPDNLTPETDDLMESFSTRRTRRSLLKGSAAGAAERQGYQQLVSAYPRSCMVRRILHMPNLWLDQVV